MTKNKQLQKFIDKALYKDNPVHSTSYIQHKVRVALNLTNDEYVFASLIEKLEQQEKMYTYDRIYNHIGMDEATANACLKTLHEKKMIKADKEKQRIVVTAVWTDAHKFNEDENFEKFYAGAYGKQWPGSKPLARDMYNLKVAREGHEKLLECKLAYFKFLSMPDNSFRNTMSAVEFLKNERYNEDWKGYMDNLPSVKKNGRKDGEDIVPSTLTQEDVNKMFD